MRRMSCRRFEEALGDYVAGTLDGTEREALDAHARDCSECGRALALWSGAFATLRDVRPEPLPPLVERRFTVRALAPRTKKSVPPPRPKLWPAFAAAFATAFVVIAGFIALVPKNGAELRKSQNDLPLLSSLEAPEDRAVQMSDGRGLLHLDPSTEVWLAPGTDASFDRVEADDVRIALREGRLIADIGPHAFPYKFVIATPSGEVEAKGTVFSVEVTPDGEQIVRVLRGIVELRSSRPGARRFLVFEGQEGVIGASSPTAITRADLKRDLSLLFGKDALVTADWLAATEEMVLASASSPHSRAQAKGTAAKAPPEAQPEEVAPVSSPEGGASSPKLGGLHADELIELALSQRQSGQFGTAATTYRQLILEYEGTLESLTALVSLGQLELYSLGRATAAAAHFESYVQRAPEGILEEEARLGLVRAYDRSNRIEDTERAATDYLKHHPRGYAAAEVTRIRADERRLTGNCEGAREDYLRLETDWPSSRHAASADSLAEKCEQGER